MTAKEEQSAPLRGATYCLSANAASPLQSSLPPPSSLPVAATLSTKPFPSPTSTWKKLVVTNKLCVYHTTLRLLPRVRHQRRPCMPTVSTQADFAESSPEISVRGASKQPCGECGGPSRQPPSPRPPYPHHCVITQAVQRPAPAAFHNAARRYSPRRAACV